MMMEIGNTLNDSSLVIVDSTLFFYQDLLSLSQVKSDNEIMVNESFDDGLTEISFLTPSNVSSDNETILDVPWWLEVPYEGSGYTQLHIILLAIFLTCIMILIVVGNTLVCIAISTEKSLKTVQNWFIASLAVSDLLLGLVIMPFSLAYELMGYWIFGNVWCEVHHALDVLLCTASINNLCLISLDRYWSVTQAVQYLKKRTPARAMFMIGFVWVFSALVCLPPLLGWKGKEIAGQCTLSDDMGYVLYSAFGSFYIPALVMVFVYARIFVAARARARRALKKKKALPIPPSEATQTVVSVSADPTKDKTTKCTSLSNLSSPVDNNKNNDKNSESLGHNKQQQQQQHTKLHKLPSIIVASSTRSSPSPTSVSPSTLVMPEIVVESSASPHSTSTRHQSEKHKEVSFQSPPSSPPGSHRFDTTETRFVVSDDIEESGSPVSSPVATKPKIGFLSPSSALSKFKASPYGSTMSIADFEDSDVAEADSLETKSKTGNKTQPMPTPRLATSEAERHKRKVAKARERRATFILGLIMASFIGAWCPFFTMYIIQGICKACSIPSSVFTVAFWLGYCNSAINPIIYTVFNRDFRKAFRKILFR